MIPKDTSDASLHTTSTSTTTPPGLLLLASCFLLPPALCLFKANDALASRLLTSILDLTATTPSALLQFHQPAKLLASATWLQLLPTPSAEQPHAAASPFLLAHPNIHAATADTTTATLFNVYFVDLSVYRRRLRLENDFYKRPSRLSQISGPAGRYSPACICPRTIVVPSALATERHKIQQILAV
ncbi:hypothetical protein LEL_09865 [Akanthomyces lecanii RCEF 1005]|uniref:Uncharacterized protein n=1 Tax=Akanthomyces lecanii RCEF 1005 TaxID=1081108 RepID=A0A162MTG0_CORDF|nr:hypothetical protein LEL_09865 [Akanthomyces lecanii RCEF 1005]